VSKTTGPYNVGFTTHKTEKGNFLAVFYPIDKDYVGGKKTVSMA
jgi:hypothetical protein